MTTSAQLANVPERAQTEARAGPPRQKSEDEAADGGMRKEQIVQLKTSAFPPGGDIPARFTCDGPDDSPALEWTEPPSGTHSFALVVDDPDAPRGTWVHWVLYGLPSSVRALPEGVPPEGELPSGARQGRNDFRRIGYGGPCPPPGPAHRYYFRLFALDRALDLKSGVKRDDVDRAMEGHVLARAELMGRYKRAG
jgi:Raf kinase inhibitor-like YbhB/YbcL family protein